jgi:hypothetical protein
MSLINKIILLILGFVPLFVAAQQREGIEIPGNEPQEKPKKEKIILPHAKTWTINAMGVFSDTLIIDTLLKNYHNFHPGFKKSITNTYTGNYGGPILTNNFSERLYNTEFYFFRNHDVYLLTPAQINYYNTTTPFTLLDYSQSDNKNVSNETRLNVLHSQNISPRLNVTFRYDQAKSDGQYNFQKNKNNFISLYSSFSGEKLNVYGGFIFNRISNQENGGITDDEKLLFTETKYVPMRLSDASADYKNGYFFATGEYKAGVNEKFQDTTKFRPIAGFIYSFLLSNNLRIFKEGENSDNSEFFPVSYLNQDFTYDSVRLSSVTNLAQLKFYESADRKYSFGKRVFAGIEYVTRSFIAPGYNEAVFPFFPGNYQGSLYAGPAARWDKARYVNTFIGGGIFRKTGKFWIWNFDGRLYLTGYKAGQTELNGIISKPFRLLKDSLSNFTVQGSLWNRVPDYFQEKYFSNRIKWNKVLQNEQGMNVKATFAIPKYHFDSGFSYSLINNFIYHDTLGIPAQTKTELLIVSAFANKEFNFRNFSVLTQILWQKVSDARFIHLPELSARLVLSYNMVISKVLFVQMGADTRYYTEYYADAYHPATGFFYLQHEKLIGNYPYIDAFANLKLKRTRVFFQYMNCGALFLNKPYFNALHYPMNNATFRLGVAWSFYN